MSTFHTEYDMNHLNRGLAVIININRIEGYPGEREGSQRDVENMSRALRSLEFDVDEHWDLSSWQIRDKIKMYSEYDHSDSDCFLCVLMSHGDEGILVASDGEDIQINALIDEIKRCRTLINKPKIFFIQACRGGNEFSRFSKLQPTPGVRFEDHLKNPTNSVYTVMKDPKNFLKDSDFLIYYATIENHAAYRTAESGSFFIGAICYVLEKYGKNKSLNDMIAKINSKVAEHGYQICEALVRLTKTLYFRSKRENANACPLPHKSIGHYRATLREHKSRVSSLVVQNDDQLISGSWDGKICVWNLNNKKIVAKLDIEDKIHSLAVKSDNELVLTTSKKIFVCDLINKSIKLTLKDYNIKSIWISVVLPKDKLASSSKEHKEIIIWDLYYQNIITKLNEHTSPVNSMIPKSQTDELASASRNEIIFWSLTNYAVTYRLDWLQGNITTFTILINGDLCIGLLDKSIIIVNVNTKYVKMKLDNQESFSRCLVQLKMEEYLASGTDDGSIYIWDMKSKNNNSFKCRLKGQNKICSLVLLRNGDLASGSDDSSIIIWDMN